MNDILNNLNEQQKEAVKYFESSLLVLAGAGSGKTRVITHKIAYLLENNFDPYQILAVTFTNKAANEMKQRVRELVHYQSIENMWIGTFHNICLRILKRYYKKVGLKNNFVIYDQNDQKKLIKDIYSDFDIECDRSDLYSMMNLISKAKSDLEEFEEVFWEDQSLKIAREYEKRLIDANAIDFDNMINFTIKLFKENDEILKLYKDRFEYILVDEYQDTNFAQFKLINLLTGTKENLCVVGDEDQSIYGWRGANIENIINFETHYPKAKVIKLEQNYRSTRSIIQAANSLISNNINRKEKRLWTDNEEGEPIRLIGKPKKEYEVNFIADKILDLKQKGISYNDIAIFVRTNAQTREIEKVLRKKTIPYQVIGSLMYFDRKEVKDILAYIKFINNPDDLMSLDRIINTPRRGIGKKTKAKIFNKIKQNDSNIIELFNKDIFSKRVNKKLNEFINIIEFIKSMMKKETISNSINELIEKVNYKQFLKKKFDNADERWENVMELINDINEYESKFEDTSLTDYLNNIALIQDIDLLEDGDSKDFVNMLTIHKSKGLEYKNVFLSGVEDGTLPHKNSVKDPDKLEEERRLFYVAMTRAQKRLYLSWSRKSFSYSSYGNNKNKISRFVKEIPDKFLKKQSFRNNFGSFPGFSKSNKRKKARKKRIKKSKRKKLRVGKSINHTEYGEGKIIATKFKNIVVDFGDSNLVEINPRTEEVNII